MIALGTHLDNLITAAESLLCKVLWVELYSLSIHMLKSETPSTLECDLI